MNLGCLGWCELGARAAERDLLASMLAEVRAGRGWAAARPPLAPAAEHACPPSLINHALMSLSTSSIHTPDFIRTHERACYRLPGAF